MFKKFLATFMSLCMALGLLSTTTVVALADDAPADTETAVVEASAEEASAKEEITVNEESVEMVLEELQETLQEEETTAETKTISEEDEAKAKVLFEEGKALYSDDIGNNLESEQAQKNVEAMEKWYEAAEMGYIPAIVQIFSIMSSSKGGFVKDPETNENVAIYGYGYGLNLNGESGWAAIRRFGQIAIEYGLDSYEVPEGETITIAGGRGNFTGDSARQTIYTDLAESYGDDECLGVEPEAADYAKALEYYLKCGPLSFKTYRYVAEIYWFGHLAPPEGYTVGEIALEYMLKAVESNDATANYYLGLWYLEDGADGGPVLPTVEGKTNAQMAVEYLEAGKAIATHGTIRKTMEAFEQLADLYEYGADGVDIDLAKAAEVYEVMLSAQYFPGTQKYIDALERVQTKATTEGYITTLDGAVISFAEGALFEEEGAVLGDAQTLADALGIKCIVNNADKTVILADDTYTVTFTDGSAYASVINDTLYTGAAAKVSNGVAYIPVEWTASTFDYDVEAAGNVIAISTPDGYHPGDAGTVVSSDYEVMEFGGYEWYVVETRNDRALIVMKDILESRSYNSDYTQVTWETSELRAYLNNDFYNTFSAEDQASIIATRISNPFNDHFKTMAGNSTVDNIFILSQEEVDAYFPDGNGAVGTTYWTRTPGIDQRFCVMVNSVGTKNNYGYRVNNPLGGVRPAMWVSVTPKDPGTHPKLNAEVVSGRTIHVYFDRAMSQANGAFTVSKYGTNVDISAIKWSDDGYDIYITLTDELTPGTYNINMKNVANGRTNSGSVTIEGENDEVAKQLFEAGKSLYNSNINDDLNSEQAQKNVQAMQYWYQAAEMGYIPACVQIMSIVSGSSGGFVKDDCTNENVAVYGRSMGLNIDGESGWSIIIRFGELAIDSGLAEYEVPEGETITLIGARGSFTGDSARQTVYTDLAEAYGDDECLGVYPELADYEKSLEYYLECGPLSFKTYRYVAELYWFGHLDPPEGYTVGEIALEYMLKAVESNDATANYYLGLWYLEDGADGGPVLPTVDGKTNAQMAVQYLEAGRAIATHGTIRKTMEAFEQLADIYEYGADGVDIDLEKALEVYQNMLEDAYFPGTQKYIDAVARIEAKIAAEDVVVTFDDAPIDFGQGGTMMTDNNVLLVNAAPLALALGLTYQRAGSIVSMKSDMYAAVIFGGSEYANVNNDTLLMDAEAVYRNGNVYVPLEWVCETFDFEVTYDGDTVCIATPDGYHPSEAGEIVSGELEVVEFGGYEWYVLEKKSDRQLIVMKDVLEERAYADSYTQVTWETSALRAYLNGEFYNTFSAEDQAEILETRIANPFNDHFKTTAGNSTVDSIFILSQEEIDAYFPDGSGAAGDTYWTRTPGIDQRFCVMVNEAGTKNNYGYRVNNPLGGVRPAMWVKVAIPDPGSHPTLNVSVEEGNDKQLFVNFDRPMSQANGGFTVDKGAETNIDITAIKWSEDCMSVVITLADPIEEGTTYQVNMRNVVNNRTNKGSITTPAHSMAIIGGVWTCVNEDGEPDYLYSGYVKYDGGLFYVTDGVLDSALQGLVQNPNKPSQWYYLAAGQAQTQVTGIVGYDGEWFYVENGQLDTETSAVVKYDGGQFYVAAGRVVTEANGLVQDPSTGTWYYVAAGQVQTQYTGLAEYDGHWFYIAAGKLDTGFSGTVEYDGANFEVVNGEVK